MPKPTKKTTKQVRSGKKTVPPAAERSAQTTLQKRKNRKKKPTQDKRPILYAKPEVRLCSGEEALTVETAKELLGWEEIAKGEYVILDHFKNKIIFNNNITNRPVYMSNVKQLTQEILRKRWQLNGEPIIVGKSGLILNGQHTLIALIIAWQTLTEESAKWEIEPDELAIDKTIVFGIDESDAIVNTMDTCKPRSLADVIYRSEYFSGITAKDRKALSKATDHAIRLLWFRTGAGSDAFSPRRTHSESISFLENHPGLLKAVKHIYEEDCGADSRISKFLSVGYASAVLYLMGTSNSDQHKYEQDRTEKVLDMSNWEKAEEFFVLLPESPEFLAIRKEIAKISNDGMGSMHGKIGVFAKAWDKFSAGQRKISQTDLHLRFEEDDEGFKTLIEFPSVGGIDLGDPENKLSGNRNEPDESTREEIEERKKQERIRKQTKAKNKK